MIIDLTDVVPENTFTEAFLAERFDREDFVPGGVNYNRGNARIQTLSSKLLMTIAERSFVPDIDDVSFLVEGTLNVADIQRLMSVVLGLDGTLYHFSGMLGEMYMKRHHTGVLSGVRIVYAAEKTTPEE